MNILHVIPSFSVSLGGPAIALKNLSMALIGKVDSQTIVSFTKSDLQIDGVEVIEFRSSGG